MINILSEIITIFLLGLLTPLTAICVLPLYPAFLVYLSHQAGISNDKNLIIKISLVIVSGVVSFMFLLGLLFTFLLKVSLTSVIGIISPIAFGLLFIISIFLIFTIDLSRFIHKKQVKLVEGRPIRNAYLYGFFFGSIVVPCNPLFIAALFARVTTTATFASGILSFITFGIGIGTPLIAFGLLSRPITQKVIGILTKYNKIINRISGIIMLIISSYYLVYVFNILGLR